MKTILWQKFVGVLCIAMVAPLAAAQNPGGGKTPAALPAPIAPVAPVAPATPSAPAAATVPVEHDMSSDQFAAGCPVSVTQPVAGDLIATGCDVNVLAEIGGDLIVLGGKLHLNAPVKQSLYAAGGDVYIASDVQRNARVAGGTVRLEDNARIDGNLSVGGGEVKINGAIGGYLQVGGGRVRINGPVAGDVEVGAGTLTLGPNARISGKLRYSGGDEIRRDDGAQVLGGIERIARDDSKIHFSIDGLGDESWHDWRHFSKEGRDFSRRGHSLLWTLGLLALAALLAGTLPGFYSELSAAARRNWPASMLLGLIVLVCVPAVALVAAVTLIGIPLALVIAAAYLMILVLGYVSAGVALGEIVLQNWDAQKASILGWRVAAAALAMLSISLLGRMPMIGWLVTLATMLTGIGILLIQLRTLPVKRAGAGI